MMPSDYAKPFLISLLLIVFLGRNARVLAQSEDGSLEIVSNAIEWPIGVSISEGEIGEEDDEEMGEVATTRRALYFWQRKRYYISYGALSANRIPCPPRSGRSYYTHNCYSARGPVHPYTRGCSAITRCRR